MMSASAPVAQAKSPKQDGSGRIVFVGLLTAAVITCLDQGSKLWLLYVFDLGGKGSVPVTPFLDLVLIWNTGISYGLFQQSGPLGQWALLAFKVVAVALLAIWLIRTNSRLTALSLGLVIGGAVGNAIDRVAHGAVVDFVFFHLTSGSFSFRWYVFNLADAAIVAGVAGLLYESVFPATPQKRPDPG